MRRNEYIWFLGFYIYVHNQNLNLCIRIAACDPDATLTILLQLAGMHLNADLECGNLGKWTGSDLLELVYDMVSWHLH